MNHPEQAAWLTRLRAPTFWWVLAASVFLIWGVHLWRPLPIAGSWGAPLHHITLFCLLYLGLRWRYSQALAFSAALGVSVLPLVFASAPLGAWSFRWVGEVGLLTTTSLAVLTVLDFRWRQSQLRLFPLWFWLVLAMAGVVASWGMHVDATVFPYFHGENSPWLARVLVLLCIVLCAQGYYWAVLPLIAVGLGYEWRILSGHNAFAYAADGLWLLGLILMPLWRHKKFVEN